MDWKENDDWKLVFPERRLFLMKHHNWAFIAWDLAKDKGWIKKDSTLYHIDQHLDEALDGALVPGLKNASGLSDLSKITKTKYGTEEYVGTDNFIWAGFARESIKAVVSISPEEPSYDYSDREMLVKQLEGGVPATRVRESIFLRPDSIEMLYFYKGLGRGILEFGEPERNRILDIDLDYFVYKDENEIGDYVYFLKEENEIRNDLKMLRDFCQWDTITVAISPEKHHIGGSDNAEFILNIFLEEFHLKIEEGKDWSVLETK